MHNSKIIEINGIFLGAAMRLPDDQGWRFVAADHRVNHVDFHVRATLAEATSMVRMAYLSSRNTGSDAGATSLMAVHEPEAIPAAAV